MTNKDTHRLKQTKNFGVKLVKMRNNYKSEIEAMQDFWSELEIVPDYSCNTDGKVNGLLFEMKLEIQSYFKVEQQIIRYIRAYNAIATNIPSKAIALNINQRKYNLYQISTNPHGDISLQKIGESDWDKATVFKDLINSTANEYSKGWICEESIVSYNNEYCKNHKKASKETVKKEFINPTELHIYPFEWDIQLSNEIENRQDNNWLTFNMNMLGCSLLRKQLGAYFTPDMYVKISTQYLEDTIEKIKRDNFEYLIIDTCAGTGNLEKFFKEEWLSNTILNTYDYTEWTTLKGIYEGRVRLIIPHTNKSRNEYGLLLEGDALSEELNNFLLQWLEDNIDRTRCKIIMIENPPFAEPQGNACKGKETFSVRDIYMYKEMGKHKFHTKNANRDLANLFIWKAFNVIKTDYYIIYSPIKYWKSQHIIDKTFIQGHCCNRLHFNSTDGCISLILWENKDKDNTSLTLTNDFSTNTIVLKHFKNPLELLKDSKEEAFAYLFNLSNMPTPENGKLITDYEAYSTYRKTQKAYSLGADNLLHLLPLWVANCYRCKNYIEINLIMKSADGGNLYQADENFLRKCFIWTCLASNKGGISNESVINHLCFHQNTCADQILSKLPLDKSDKKILLMWESLLIKAKEKEEYNNSYTYGLFQIERDINLDIECDRKNKKGEVVKVKKYNNNGDVDQLIQQLKIELELYREKYINPKLFEYKLLK